MSLVEVPELIEFLRREAAALGFSQIGVADVDLSVAEEGLLAWLEAGFHGEMAYMERHGLRRARPAELRPGTSSVITARLDYLPRPSSEPAGGSNNDDWRAIEWHRLEDPAQATVSLYARGRDYHKTMRQRLGKLADALQQRVGPFGHRVFTDSAPVLEVELASRSGIGWRGKHTLALDRDGGSMFFLGEIYIDLALPPTPPVDEHCGSCRACIDVCPTGAIVAPYRLDARRCISYLTIEHAGPIPVELRPALGNRIYGCDDCQLVCPWNKFARKSGLAEFDVRPPFGDATLLALWRWTEADFLRLTEGSAIRRIGHARWRRNLAVALGNLLRDARCERQLADEVRAALAGQRDGADDLLREHIDWALAG
ncbi:tRNA epoxyqueuosine(34) reductase QueG [Piscinibacter sakaiensis]|uniref:tRNA epoxyqueuosine(34) reductase QueG n=1 Tax=Piscinibacter sakaiensis TaxID=1547922 RepID=UPI003AAD6140